MCPEFLEELRKICLAHDKREGQFPDHQFEGLSIYAFASGMGDYDYDIEDEWKEEVAHVGREAD